MNSIHSLLDQPVFQALGWTLVHFMWEGAAVALLVLIARSAIRKSSARLRYTASCAGLTLLLAAPAITFCVVYRPLDGSTKASPTSITQKSAPGVAAELAPPTAESAEMAAAAQSPPSSASFNTLLKQWFKDLVDSLMPWLVGIWFLGVLLLSSRFAAGLSVARRLKRTGTEAAPALWQTKLGELKHRLGVSRPVRLYKSLLVEVPTVAGWLRPVILLPASALTGLRPEQLEALLAHELAHIRRYDYLVNIIQTAVETLLFYHPAVWWISGQVRVERENCCDDMAVSACGDVLTYARALAELESMRTRRPQLAMAADGGSLLNRIERLVGKAGSPKRHQVGPSLAVLAAIAALMIMLAGAGGMEPVLVQGAIQQARIMGIAPLSGFPRFSGSVEHPGGDPAKHSADPSTTAKTEDRRADQSTAASGPAPASSANSSATAETPAVPQSEKSDDYIGSMKTAFGSKDISIDDLVALKIQDVTAEYIKELRAAGYDKLTIHQVIALKAQEVSADYIKQMASAGYANLPVNDLIAMKIQTVTPDYIRALGEHGFSNLPASRIIAMKIQGVTPEYIDQMKAAGYDKLSPSELIGMKIQGVNPEYVKEMKTTGLDDLSARSLVSLKIQGVTPEYVKEMRGIGFGGSSASHFIAMKIQGVTPDYIKAMKDAGLKDLNDRDVIGLKTQDVSPEYIRTMASAGFSHLSSHELIAMRIQRVTPEFVSEMKSAGYSGLKVEELIAFRIHGVDAAFVKRMRDHGFKDLTSRQLIQLKIAGIE